MKVDENIRSATSISDASIVQLTPRLNILIFHEPPPRFSSGPTLHHHHHHHDHYHNDHHHQDHHQHDHHHHDHHHHDALSVGRDDYDNGSNAEAARTN